MRIAVYMRVSTDDQSTEAQKTDLDEWLEVHTSESDEITWFKDEAMSGKNIERPEFRKMYDAMFVNSFDRIVTYKLDRISRNVIDALQFVLDCHKTSTDLYSITEPHLNPGIPFRMALTAIACEVSQTERENTIRRIKSGMKAAMADPNKQVGRKRKAKETEIYELYKAGMSASDISDKLGVSSRTVYRNLNRYAEKND